MKKPADYQFIIYITGNSPNSAQAVFNLNALCREHLADRHHIEIVDVLREPKRALADGIMLTPTLVKISPAPSRKIIGTLSQPQPVLQALELPV
jgi:circadian clock protein KaiB